MERVVEWIDRWMARSGIDAGVRCLVQRGTSHAPRHADSEPYLPFDDVVASMREAAAVVTHAGTGSVMLARQQGIVPIVVPRMRSHGEAVDDHQVGFARRMATLDEIVLALDEPSLTGALDLAIAEPARFRRPRTTERTEAAIVRFEDLVGPLLRRRR